MGSWHRVLCRQGRKYLLTLVPPVMKAPANPSQTEPAFPMEKECLAQLWGHLCECPVGCGEGGCIPPAPRAAPQRCRQLCPSDFVSPLGPVSLLWPYEQLLRRDGSGTYLLHGCSVPLWGWGHGAAATRGPHLPKGERGCAAPHGRGTEAMSSAPETGRTWGDCEALKTSNTGKAWLTENGRSFLQGGSFRGQNVSLPVVLCWLTLTADPLEHITPPAELSTGIQLPLILNHSFTGERREEQCSESLDAELWLRNREERRNIFLHWPCYEFYSHESS